MSHPKADKHDLRDITKRIEMMAQMISDKNGQTVDIKQKPIFAGGSFLHQSTDSMSEEQSAQFERDNPEFFAYLRSLDDAIESLF